MKSILTSVLSFLLLILLSCNKDQTEFPDYRNCYLGTYEIEYMRIDNYYIAGTIDTTYESFTGTVSKYHDKYIGISGSLTDELIGFEVDSTGALFECGSISAGTISCDSINVQYGANGFVCANMPNGWIGHFKITGVRQ